MPHHFKHLTFADGFINQPGPTHVGDYASPEQDMVERMGDLISEGAGAQHVTAEALGRWADGVDAMMEGFDDSIMFDEGIDGEAVFAMRLEKLAVWFTLAPQSFKARRDKFIPGVPVAAIFAALAMVALDKALGSAPAEPRHMMEAGKAMAYAMSFDLLELETDSRHETGRKGGLARAARYATAKDYALKLANAGRYPSRRQAVLGIKEQVLEFMRKEGIPPLSAYQAEKTLDGWLKAAGYTPSSR